MNVHKKANCEGSENDVCVIVLDLITAVWWWCIFIIAL